MTKFLAMIAIFTLMALSGLGNFWFTYGLWPRSWITYTIFFFTGLILSLMMQQVLKAEK